MRLRFSRLDSNRSLTSIVQSSLSRHSCQGSGWKFGNKHSVISFSVASAYDLTNFGSKYLIFANLTKISKNSNLLRPLEGALDVSTLRFAAM